MCPIIEKEMQPSHSLQWDHCVGAEGRHKNAELVNKTVDPGFRFCCSTVQQSPVHIPACEVQHHPIYNISNLVPLFLVWLTLKLKLNFLFCISSNCCNTPTASQLLCLMQCYFQFECSLIHEQSTEGLLWMTKRTPPKTFLKIIGLQW